MPRSRRVKWFKPNNGEPELFNYVNRIDAESAINYSLYSERTNILRNRVARVCWVKPGKSNFGGELPKMPRCGVPGFRSVRRFVP